jgi:hypothetical protein
MERVDRELRDWLRGLGEPRVAAAGVDAAAPLSPEGADYLVGIVLDGTLRAALDELGAADPELAG